MFQAGLASLVLSKFRGTLVTLAVYFILCLALHIWGLTLRWNDTSVLPSTTGYLILLTIQRTWAILYYFFYKRDMYRLGDIRLYMETDALRKQFEKKG
ncbi:transmembrane protein [Fasciolopsis buskii]|uniref:Transmembrane protein 138 n=1 Tax=Fasciolopsis buskii TaxID=27845 RepID=A0A8E0RZI6_9TREM|nr:transmembrane protein [Fasciolopsis buski]